MSRCIALSLLVCCLLPLAGIAQEEAQINPLYESVVFPDRTFLRRLEQVDRLFESGRSSEAAQLLGNLLENAHVAFLQPENAEERTLRQTVSDHLIDRIRKLPKEARDSYAFQFEPIAKRLLENALATGSLDEIQQIAQKYFPTASGASAVFLVGLSQLERGDFAAAFLTLDRLKHLHPSLPKSLTPLLPPMLDEVQARLQHVAEPLPGDISEAAWLEQIGWRIPAGLPSQNPSTKATLPLFEQNWTVPQFTRLPQERTTDRLSRMVRRGVYIPASQPLVVGDLFLTRTLDEVIAVDTNTGKRLWVASEPQYHFPETEAVLPLVVDTTSPAALRFFFWHNRIAHQLSSDGERLFCIDGHHIDSFGGRDFRQLGRLPRLPGNRGDDLRYAPGSTLSARDVKTGQLLWQVGKFPYVQKYLATVYAPGPRASNSPAVNIDDTLFTDDEKTFKETWFLGAPLSLQGRLYVMGETEGVLQLLMLESQTGRLIARQTIAHPPSSMTADVVRRTYPMFPSASGGIVICPSGSKLVVALDATTLAPIWCFSYAPQTPSPTNRTIRNLPRMMSNMSLGDNDLQYFLSNSGWQVPSMIVDRQRVLIAPPDQAALYCLDLLSGELLWHQLFSRRDTLYVAGVREDKIFLVTPNKIMTIDLKTWRDVSREEHQFPAGLRPVGVGVRSGDQYFIPFTDGYLAVADWKEGTMSWWDSSGLAVSSPVSKENVSSVGNLPGSLLFPSLYGGSGYGRDENVFSPDLTAEDVFQKPMEFGNLVGIKGRFFSQAPTQIACFDQKEPLRQRAETLLRDNPHDPAGLLQQGRLLQSEGRLAEAIDSFRASLKAKPTAEAADFLRKNLLEAMRNDFTTWSHARQELESLVELPGEWGAILYAQLEGILQSGRTEGLASLVEKIAAFGQDQAALIPVSSDYAAQLPRVLGSVIAQRPAFKATWEELAETFLARSAGNDIDEMKRLSMFVHLFRNTRAAERAKQMLREQDARVPIAEVSEGSFPEWSALSHPHVWRSGKVTVTDATDATASSSAATRPDPNRNEVDNIVARLVSAAKNATFSGRDQLTVPFLGMPDPELSTLRYFLQSWSSELFLCCTDGEGEEQWRIAVPNMGFQDFGRIHSSTSASCYVKGFRNFLLFVQGNAMTAISISRQPERTPKILWTQTVSSMLMSQQSGDRRSGDARQNLTTDVHFPQNSIFISPHVVCCWEGNSVYGLDPMTGQTLWVRKAPGEHCSLLGDADNLFLVFFDVRQVMAVDPASGRELSTGRLPTNGTYIFGTNIVCVKRQGNEFALHLCDLRDMHPQDIHKQRRLALSVRDAPEGQTPEIPSTFLHTRLNNTSRIQTFHGGRFLSVATWGTKSLQIYDLLTKEKLLPEENTLLQFVPEGQVGSSMRCDIEFVEDRFLVVFTKDIDVTKNSPETVEDNGKLYRRAYNPVQGASTGIGEGAMMLFDSAGNPCWAQPVEIKNWCRLVDVPDRLPVMLFAATYSDRELVDGAPAGPNISRTAIMGIDKRSGEQRFRSRATTASATPSLQPFRVSADPQAQTITLMTLEGRPLRVVQATFTDEEP